MAVSVDTVYQRVLALANKEQRGYITPQEFNLLANQAQTQLFEQYFYDLNQQHRNPGIEISAGDSVDDLEDKISIFQVYDFPLDQTSGQALLLPINSSIGYPAGTKDLYKLEEVRHNDNICTQVTPRKMHLMKKSVFAAQPVVDHPIYLRLNNTVEVKHFNTAGGFANIFNNVKCDYIRKPNRVEWDYVVVNEKALYNANGSSDFEVHPAEEANLVYKILELAGIIINKPGISTYGKGEKVEADNIRKA